MSYKLFQYAIKAQYTVCSLCAARPAFSAIALAFLLATTSCIPSEGFSRYDWSNVTYPTGYCPACLSNKRGFFSPVTKASFGERQINLSFSGIFTTGPSSLKENFLFSLGIKVAFLSSFSACCPVGKQVRP